MRGRVVMFLLLVAGLLGPVTGTAHAAAPVSGAVSAQGVPGTFAVTIAEKGPFAPGTAVTISLSGGRARQFVIVEQCAAAHSDLAVQESVVE